MLKEDINMPNKAGQTKLMSAAYKGKITSVKKLLKAGADVKIKCCNNNGDELTALHFAMLNGNSEIVDLLANAEVGKCESKNEKDLKIMELIMDAPDFVIDTYQNPDRLSYFYIKQSDIILKNPDLAERILSLSNKCQSCKNEFNGQVCQKAYRTLENIAEIRPELANKALDVIEKIEKSHHGIYSISEINNMNIFRDEFDEYYMTEEKGVRKMGKEIKNKVSQIASQNHINKALNNVREKLIKTQHNKKTNDEIFNMFVPQGWHSSSEMTETIKTLVEKGYDINTQNSEGNTPLMKMVYTGHIETVETCLELGAKVGIKNNKGETALSIAEKVMNECRDEATSMYAPNSIEQGAEEEWARVASQEIIYTTLKKAQEKENQQISSALMAKLKKTNEGK